MTTSALNLLLVLLFASGSAFNLLNKFDLQDDIRNEKRIVEGFDVEDGDADFVVAILLNGTFFSQGCLYKENYVLTVAKPLIGLSPNELLVSFGSNRAEELGRTTVTNIYRHYYFTIGSTDIAILELDSSGIPREVYTKNVTLFNESLPEEGIIKFYMFGWGSTSPGGAYSNLLQYSITNYISTSYCQSWWYRESIGRTMVCASRLNIKACDGDDGAPL